MDLRYFLELSKKGLKENKYMTLEEFINKYVNNR